MLGPPLRSATAAPMATGLVDLAGLSQAEAEARRRAGRGNTVAPATGRSVAHILRANVFTRFNALLGVLFVIALVVGPVQDALFGVILAVNTAIGIAQELRAKWALDHLAVLTAPRAAVRREGTSGEVESVMIVEGDVVELRPGDQLLVDGPVLEADGLEVDESLLTGEAEPVPKRPGDQALSGSFVTAGTGCYLAERVGEAAYARRVQAEGQRFQLVHSELRAGTDRILQVVSWAMVPAAGLLVSAQLWRSHQTTGDALRSSVAGVSAMVPEGLVLLTTLAFAVGALRLARQRVLVQELAAVEGLARVDTVCIDKTGTLTERGIELDAVEALDGTDSSPALAALVAAEPNPNASLRAIAAAVPAAPELSLEDHVPFSSARKWSAVRLAGGPSWVLGGPDVLFPAGHVAVDGAVRAHTTVGRRVLLLARSSEPLGEALPAALAPVALVVLRERLRPDAGATVGYLLEQGITVNVLSGDDPATVASVADRVGIPPGLGALDARSLPEDPEALVATLRERPLLGRVRPDQKRDIVRALQAAGHVVAMTGDGVNDVTALKQADLGIAMGSGTAASRAVGSIVLLDDAFAALPRVTAEGRRVIANIERVANLFVTKTVYAAALAVAVGVAGVPFPFYPRHLTIVSSLTIGIPGFFLALAPNTTRARPGFLGRMIRFVVPAGLAAAMATLASFALAREVAGASLVVSRTAATIALFSVAFWILVLLTGRVTRLRLALLVGLAAAFAAVLALGFSRTFFGLRIPGPAVLAGVAAIVAVAGLAIVRLTAGALRRSGPLGAQ